MSADNLKIRTGIIGGAGYAAGELLRILLRHPNVGVEHIQSSSHAGKPAHSVHRDLIGDTDLVFSNSNAPDCDALFLCLAHGQSQKWLAENAISPKVKIIDLSQDFRYSEDPGFCYGLPELWRDQIRREKKHIANPGCFATAIQLALLPLAQRRELISEIHSTAITGSTGAGQALSQTSHFSFRSQNAQVYKPFNHQHMREIGISLRHCAQSDIPPIYFIPIRGNFTRGIHASTVLKTSLNQARLRDAFIEFYSSHPFVIFLSEGLPDMKMAVQTNKCVIGLEVQDNMALIVSVIDNLIKGAAGQAVQNMNLLFDLPEETGLMLKPCGF